MIARLTPLIRTLILLGTKTWEGFTRDNCSQMAAAIAYHILFSIVPVVMFLIAVVGMFAGSDQFQQRLTDALSEQFDLNTADVVLELTPDGVNRIEDEHGAAAVIDVEEAIEALNEDELQAEERTAIANTLREGEAATVAGIPVTKDDIDIHFDNLVLEAIREVVNTSSALGVVSILLLGYAASGLFGVIRRSLDFVWNTPRHKPMVTGKLWDVLMLFVLAAMVVFMLLALVLLSIAAGIIFQVIGNARSDAAWIETAFWWFIGFLGPMLFSFVLFLLLYRYGPHTKNRLRDVWPGALLAAFGFEILKFGYSIYLRNFVSFDAVYGALGGVLLFLLFVYLSAQLFLLCAELAAEYPRVMSGEYAHTGPPPPPTTLRQKIKSGIRSLFVRDDPPT